MNIYYKDKEECEAFFSYINSGEYTELRKT